MAFIKMRMRTEFIIRNGLDILLLQEVVTEDLYPIYGYTIHINIGTERRGTASDPGFDAFRGHRKITKVILKNIIEFMLDIVHFRVVCNKSFSDPTGLRQHNQSKIHAFLAARSI